MGHRIPRKTSLLLSAIFAVFALTLASSAYVTWAWFSSKRTATVNFQNMQMSEGLSSSIRYFTDNDLETAGTNHGYLLSSEVTKVSADGSFAYNDTYFPTVTDTSATGPLGYLLSNPGYASSFVFEITNGGSTSDVSLFLLKYLSTASTSQYSDDNSALFCLSEATEIFTGFWSSTSDDLTISQYAKAYFSTAQGSFTDKFAHVDAGGTDLTDPEIWATWSIPSGEVGYFFVSIYFSNDASTFYSLSADQGTDGYTHWSKDATNGNSMCYQNLTISFPNISLNYV